MRGRGGEGECSLHWKTNHLNVNQGGANCQPIILPLAHYDKVEGGRRKREMRNGKKEGGVGE